MNSSMRDDFKRDGLVTQIIKRLADLEAFEREMRLKQFGSGGGGGDWVLIDDQPLAADTANFDFTAIPATYTTLKMIVSVRSDRASNSDKINLKVNNDATAGNYFSMLMALYHSGTTTSEEFLGTTQPVPVGYALANTSPANGFAEYEFTFPDYSSSGKFKDFQVRGGGRFDTGTGNLQMFDTVGQWASTTAINRLTLTVNLGTVFKQFSRATLYGIT